MQLLLPLNKVQRVVSVDIAEWQAVIVQHFVEPT